MKISINQMVKMGMLAALAIVLTMLVHFPLPLLPNFLVYDPADVPILVGTFMFGPVAGLLITVVSAAIQATLLSSDGIIGFVMHVIATGTLVMVSGLIYRRLHTLKGAIIALSAGAISMALIMIPANLFFTVKFYGVPYDQVVSMILPAILPFNLVKAFTNSLIVTLIYKPLSKAFKGFGKKSEVCETTR